jgi:hypothetical protein
MTQDKLNPPSVTEEPQSSDQNPATLVTPVSEQIAVETQVAKSETEESEDEFSEAAEEEEEETEDASAEETTDAETSPPNTSTDSTSSNATQSTSPTSQVEKDERSEIEKQPYDFDHCTVQIAIQLMPNDGDANGRMVVVGVRSHLDTPLLRLVRLNQFGTLPPVVIDLLNALIAELPAREQAAREAFEKKKAEKAKRQSTVTTASKTTRGKKAKPTLTPAPASSSATTDNRPRPEVKVSGTPQQQMGLF